MGNIVVEKNEGVDFNAKTKAEYNPEEEAIGHTVWDKNWQIFVDWFEDWEAGGVTTHNRTAKALTQLEPESILEIGSGTGILYRELLRKGFQGKYLGLDQTYSFVAYCSNMYGDGLFRMGKAEEVYIPGMWDICVMQDVLRHNEIANRYKILDNVVPHVKRQMILAEPLADEESEEWVEAVYSRGGESMTAEHWDGELDLFKTMNYIEENLKHVEKFTTIERNDFEQDKRKNYFILVVFGEDDRDGNKKE